MGYNNEQNIHKIIDFFRGIGYPDNFIAGLLGNWQSETASTFNPTEVQHSYKRDNTQYTREADNGSISFCTDRIGYGMAQWTSSGRKTGLYNYAHSVNKSVGDLITQCEWTAKEISSVGYGNVRKAIKNDSSIEDCARVICTDYERPASMQTSGKEAAIQTRINYALKIYETFFQNEGNNKEDKMAYTNSSLVEYTQISPCKNTNRKYPIDTIIIHCYVGQVSVERMGKGWAKTSANASANYGIGTDGRIGLYVDEKDRAWTTGGRYTVNGWTGAMYDHRSVTIECACDSTAPYAINDKVLQSLIKLCADIAKRNGIKELKWKGDKTLIGKPDQQNMVVHRWFTPKACPGDYIYNRLGYIATEANKLINGETETTATNPASTTTNQNYTYHTVVKGETLAKIAFAYDTTPAIIMANNSDKITNINKISVGWVLKIPVNANSVPKTYTVVSGDTLAKIASSLKKSGISITWLQLAKLNNIKAPYIIRKGQVLKIQ